MKVHETQVCPLNKRFVFACTCGFWSAEHETHELCAGSAEAHLTYVHHQGNQDGETESEYDRRMGRA